MKWLERKQNHLVCASHDFIYSLPFIEIILVIFTFQIGTPGTKNFKSSMNNLNQNFALFRLVDAQLKFQFLLLYDLSLWSVP